MIELIEPVQAGTVLLNDIAQTQPAHGEVAIWWLGQSGYVIKTATALFAIDLYLSEHLTRKYAQSEKPHIRMTRAPLRGGDLRGIRWVFASHKHSDHLDPDTLPALLAANPEARLVLPLAIIDHAARGIDEKRFIPARGDETLALDGMRIYVIPSAHPSLDYTEQTGYPFLGFVFEVDGIKLYHSGDTLVYPGLAERLKAHALDVAFLPINGTDERRDRLQVPPNMNMDEALALAAAIGKPLVIPHHYDMFTFNTAEVSEFARKAADAKQPYHIMKCGEKFIWPG